MNIYIKILVSILLVSCSGSRKLDSHILDIEVLQLSPNTYMHTSFLKTKLYGMVGCNGMIVVSQDDAIIFDTPTDDKGSEQLYNWIQDSLKVRIKSVVATHFHEDCLGGLKFFHDKGIPSFANQSTIDLSRKNDMPVPQEGFINKIIMKLGEEEVICEYLGPGHTADNIVVYYPKDKVLFGGCLVKTLNAGKGYLGDADISQWPATVTKVKAEYSMAEIVIPGHGKHGNTELLDYTVQLFKSTEN